MFDPSITCCFLYVISKYGYPPPANQVEKYLEEFKHLGFKSIELEGIRKEHLTDMYEQRFSIKNKVKELDLSVPYFCIVLPGLASANQKEREENLILFEKGCEIAEMLGAKGVLDNAPLPPYQFPDNIPVVRHYDEDILLSARFPENLQWNKYWQDMVGTYRDACDIAAAKGLTYQMHPCLGVLSATTDAFLYFCDAVARDNLRFNLDTANQFVMKDNLSLSLRRLADFIDYIHISDNRGQKVEHLPPGDGNIHWESFFETLDVINFKGHLGLDIGGDESNVKNLEQAYTNSAQWLEEKWIK